MAFATPARILTALLALAAIAAGRLAEPPAKASAEQDTAAARAELADAKRTIADARKLSARAKAEYQKAPKDALEDQKDAARLVNDAKREVAQAGLLAKAAKSARAPHAIASAPAKKPIKKMAVSKKPPNAEEQLDRLQQGLLSIQSLRKAYVSGGAAGAGKFADGAMSDELSKQDSSIWSAITSMLGAAQNATRQMKGKSKEAKQKLMAKIEDSMNAKADALTKVVEKVGKKQQEEDEEYLLGLLNMHQKEWSLEHQLNATAVFAKDSPVIASLLRRHSDGQPLAPQLAKLMDAEKGGDARSAPKAAAAARLFLELAASHARTTR